MDFNYDFCVRVTARPQGVRNVSKQLDLEDRHTLFRSFTDVLNLYKAFPEPHLNTHQLDILEKLKEYLNRRFKRSIMAATHIAYPDLAIDKFSGRDCDQDAKSNIILIEPKIIIDRGDTPGDAGELANYTSRRKVLFSFFCTPRTNR